MSFISDLNPFNPSSALGKSGLAPALEALALNYFVPGIGEAAGLGLSNAATTGLIVGGANALASGSLQKGIMAGLGAYGATGLGEAAMGGVRAANTEEELAKKIGLSTKDYIAAPASVVPPELTTGEAFKAGIKGISSLGAKDLLKYGAAAALPALMQADRNKYGMPTSDASKQAYIRPKYYDYRTQTYYDLPAVKASDWGSQSLGEYRSQYAPNIGAAEGGLQAAYAEGGTTVDNLPNNSFLGQVLTPSKAYENTGASADAYKYLTNQTLSSRTPYQPLYTPTSNAKYILTNSGQIVLNPNYVDPLRASVKASGIGDTGVAGVDSGGGGAGIGSISGNGSVSSSSTSSTGSPTGSTIGDIGYAISNQSISPVAAAIASAMMDAMSPTSVTSVNAVSGLDAQSDAATAMGASTAAGVNGPAGASSTGMGSDVSGEGAAPGGGSAPGGGDAPGGGGDGGSAADARGGFYHKGRFDYHPHMARGGLSDAYYNLGGYSDGGRLLRGPGDGVSDSIPAVIGNKQPARLADGEFVVPARIVSEIGNGSTEAGARKLYAMMDRIQAARKKTVGKGKVAKNTRADKYLPA